METGNVSASIISWPTAFLRDDEKNAYSNEAFSAFLSNRLDFSERLNSETYQTATPEVNGYYSGWGPTSQDVVIPSFIAAYTGKDLNEVSSNPFKVKVQPNWNVTYDGLSKIPSIKKYFKQFNLKHSYRSTFTTSYISNLNFTPNEEGLPTTLDQSEFPNYITRKQINSVNISEQITPLSIDMTLKTKKKKNKGAEAP